MGRLSSPEAAVEKNRTLIYKSLRLQHRPLYGRFLEVAAHHIERSPRVGPWLPLARAPICDARLRARRDPRGGADDGLPLLEERVVQFVQRDKILNRRLDAEKEPDMSRALKAALFQGNEMAHRVPLAEKTPKNGAN
jgi:hypothetical protein